MGRLVYISSGALVVGLAAGAAGIWYVAAHPEASASGGGLAAVLGSLAGNEPAETAQATATPVPNPAAASPGLAVAKAQELGGLNVDGQTNQAGQGVGQAQDPNALTLEMLKSYEQYKDNQTGLYQDLKAGTGDEAVSGKTVSVQYRGWLTNGTVFDESYARGQAFGFTLGAGQVISGWDNGLVGMKVGGKRRLIVPPAAGYGNQAVGSIPAGSLLVFEVELEAVK